MKYKPIGLIYTPFSESNPIQPAQPVEGDFKIVLYPEYYQGLKDLESFKYIFVVFELDTSKKKPSMRVTPPWAKGKKVGVFASRSAQRPNPIGISIVEIKTILENTLYISETDVYNGTPVLDIKPYIKDLDSKEDANFGWIESLNNKQDIIQHIRNLPH